MIELELLPSLHEKDCAKCKLNLDRSNIVPSYLPKETQVLFIAEAPGADEDREGLMPLIGNAGKFLNECIKAAGFDREDSIFGFANTVRCRPVEKGNNRQPKETEIKSCSDYLDKEIENLPNLKVIVCLGSIASNRIVGKIGLRIEDVREFVLFSKKYSKKVIVTYHPAAPLYSASLNEKSAMRASIIEDIQKAVLLTREDYKPLQNKAYICDNITKVKWLFEKLKQQDLVAWDIETNGLDYFDSKMLCHSFSWQVGTGVVLPLLGQYSEPFWNREEYDEVFCLLKEFLENKEIRKVAQNGKFDILHCKAHGINVQNFYADTMLLHYCYNENLDHGLKTLAWLYTDYGGYEEELDEIRTKYAKENNLTKKEASFDILPNEVLWPYSATDPDTTLQIYYKLLPLVEKEGTDKIFFELYMPLVRLFIDMEFEGINIDKQYLDSVRIQFKEKIDKLQKQINLEPQVQKYIILKKESYKKEKQIKWENSKNLQSRYTLEEYCEKNIEDIVFNYGSTKQLKELFIDQIGVKVKKKTVKGNPSFDAEAIEVYANKIPVAKLIAEVKKASTLLTTFLDGIAERLKKDGRIHTSLNLHITSTGRLSSSNPNLQNVPNKTNNPEDSKLIRDIFVADSEECSILEFDEGQIEFRIWAQLSQDPVMIADLIAGLDIHRNIASESFKIPKEEVTKELRDKAKGVVFGKMYGRGNKSVSEQLGCSIQEAERIEAILFSKYKVASFWLNNTIREAKRNKHVKNMYGFKRHLKGLIDSYDSNIRAAAERLAINSPIQGGASQTVCFSMLKAAKLFKENNIRGRLLFPIHDAILFNIHNDDIDKALPLIYESMLKPHPVINIPLTIDGKIGYRWGSTISIEDYHQK